MTASDRTAHQPELSLGGKVGYATGVYGVFLAWMMVAIFLLYFYTDVLGLSPAKAGLVFFVASMWDAVSDPLMGWFTEKTRSRWGRYRPYLLFAAIPFAGSFAALFIKPDLSGEQLFWWCLVLHIVFRTAYTAIYIPYTALIARLSSDADERASIAGFKGSFISLGALTVSLFGLPAVTLLGGEDEAAGFLRFALICAGMAVVALWTCFLLTREKAAPEESSGRDSASKASPWATVKAIIANRPFIMVFAAVILFTGCYTMLNKTIVYVFKYDIGSRDAATYALSAIGVAGVISPLLWVRVTHRTSKRTVAMSGCLIAAAALLLIYWLNLSDIVALTALFLVVGVGIHGFLMTFYAMVADTADWGEYQRGWRVEAPLFGIMSFANKSSLAVGTWTLGGLLELVGFEANVDQSAETLAGLRQIMSLVPMLGFLAAAGVIAFFPINAVKQREIMAAITDRKRLQTVSENQGDRLSSGTTVPAE